MRKHVVEHQEEDMHHLPDSPCAKEKKKNPARYMNAFDLIVQAKFDLFPMDPSIRGFDVETHQKGIP